MFYMTIYFSKESDAYGESSNFATYPIVIHDVLWHTSEHYFQAMQLPHDPEYQEIIRTTKICQNIKILGSTRQIMLRSDWEEVQYNIMMIALRAKFDQYPELKQLLLSTAGNSLVEHTEMIIIGGTGVTALD